MYVHQDQIRSVLLCQCYGLLAPGRMSYGLVAQFPQLHGNVHGDDDFVFYNQDAQ